MIENQQNKEVKLPMFYEQVNGLMKLMAKAFLNNRGQHYFRSFRQLYSRVRPDLKKEKKKYYDEKIKELEKKVGIGIETSEFSGYVSDFRELKIAESSKALLRPVYDLETELFQDLDNLGILKVLKIKNEAELI